ncbi:MAG: hypothetical protein ABIH87_01960 [bacterium]
MSVYTLQLFRHLFENLPPLFPDDLVKEIEQRLQEFEQSGEVLIDELEKEMVKYGYHVWPYAQAHKEFLYKAQDKLADHFLLPYLSDGLQKKYLELRDYGESWDRVYNGQTIHHFDSGERVLLARAFIQARNKLKQYVEQEIKGTGRDKYLQRVGKYNQILGEMKNELDNLKELAEQEKDHPVLARELGAKIQDIEHSLCLLGRELQHHELFNAREHFIGRKEELSRLRGIHEPLIL